MQGRRLALLIKEILLAKHVVYPLDYQTMHINSKLNKIVAILLFGIGAGIIANQLKTNPPNIVTFTRPTPTPQWQEQPVVLTDIEQATMSGNFTKEFQTALEEEKITPKPIPIWTLDVPSSMAGDIMAPTVTISGGPSEGATITYANPCFPLWVSDNMTPWKQLVTRSKLDNGQWGSWMNYFSYCFDNLGNGPHTIRIQIRDLAGNVSSEVKRVFIVKR